MRYGSICSSCRKTLTEEALRRRKQDTEGSGTQETGHKIDAKVRVQIERDNQEEHSRIEEDYYEERTVDSVTEKKQFDKKETKLETEKKHRDALFSKRTPPGDKKPAVIAPPDKTNLEQHNVKEDQLKTQHNYNAPFHDPQVAGQARFHSAVFQEYRKRLGRHSSLLRTAESAEKRAGKSPEENTNETLAEHIERNFGPKSKK